MTYTLQLAHQFIYIMNVCMICMYPRSYRPSYSSSAVRPRIHMHNTHAHPPTFTYPYLYAHMHMHIYVHENSHIRVYFPYPHAPPFLHVPPPPHPSFPFLAPLRPHHTGGRCRCKRTCGCRGACGRGREYELDSSSSERLFLCGMCSLENVFSIEGVLYRREY